MAGAGVRWQHPPLMDTAAPLAALRAFRRDLYSSFTRRADAVFEVVDAILAAESIPSLPHLSLAPLHRRGWGSVYAALAEGRLDAERVRAAVASHPLASGQPIYTVGASVWPRCDAEASPGRGYYDHPARHSAGRPIVAGWAYQRVA